MVASSEKKRQSEAKSIQTTPYIAINLFKKKKKTKLHEKVEMQVIHDYIRYRLV